MSSNFSSCLQFYDTDSLGGVALQQGRFHQLEEKLNSLQTESFKKSNELIRTAWVSELLYQLIQEAEEPCFLLPAVADFISVILEKKVVTGYSLSTFELWLSLYSQKTAEENLAIRAKIVGKKIPRDAYQTYFPVGMGKIYPGSHYVTGHASPDIDTTVASFWGFVDAFGARVSEGLHIWNVPGGVPTDLVEVPLLFSSVFGEASLKHLAKTKSTLSLSALDLLHHKDVEEHHIEKASSEIDHHRFEKKVIVVDDDGHFIGDWRAIDVESVFIVIMNFYSTLRAFENRVHLEFSSYFSSATLSDEGYEKRVNEMALVKFSDLHCVKNLIASHRENLNIFLKKVLKLRDGVDATFAHFMNQESAFDPFIELIQNAQVRTACNSKEGCFSFLVETMNVLDKAISEVRKKVDTLGVAYEIKSEVFNLTPKSINFRSEIDEIRSEMRDLPYITVTHRNSHGKEVALGVIVATDLYKTTLGTVSLRDFANLSETRVPSYFEVLSVVDHHKFSLHSSKPPVVLITDAQSANGMLAEQAFSINDQYGSGGMSLASIKVQIDALKKDHSTPAKQRALQKLLQKQLNLETKRECYVDPQREYLEYLNFLYAICDDTDLLSKVSARDIKVVVELLNRMHTIRVGKEEEIVHLDDIEFGESFAKEGAKRILQNRDMYSLYKKVYDAKERVAEQNIEMCAKDGALNIFSDTKFQAGYARVGQTKLFAKNFDTFKTHQEAIQNRWFEKCKEISDNRSEIMMHLQMISTINGADEMYRGEIPAHTHQDELWFYIPETEQSIEALKRFLGGFKKQSIFEGEQFEVEFAGGNRELLASIFEESFNTYKEVKSKRSEQLSITILRFKPSLINSRKTAISPYLAT